MQRILFVDDEMNVLDGLRRALGRRRDEWKLHFASGFIEAIDVLEEFDCDTVVSDVNMPGRDGFDLLAEIRRNPRTKDIPVIILTGADDRGLKRRALDSGATDLLMKPADSEELVARIDSALRLKSYQDTIRDQTKFLEQKVDERTAMLERARIDLVWRLGKAGECRDSDTGNHVIRVGCYASILAKTLGLDDEFAKTIFLASPLHDIGKIGIPDRILLKPGKLDPDEWVVMKQHTLIGAEILRKDIVGNSRQFEVFSDVFPTSKPSEGENPFVEMAANIAVGHHERWDGTGYPVGLGGDAISVEARITAVADVFDALSSKRPYKNALSEEETLEIMLRGNSTHFDPSVLQAFEEAYTQILQVQSQLADPLSMKK